MQKEKSYVQGIYECLNEFCKSYCKYDEMMRKSESEMEEETIRKRHCNNCILHKIM